MLGEDAAARGWHLEVLIGKPEGARAANALPLCGLDAAAEVEQQARVALIALALGRAAKLPQLARHKYGDLARNGRWSLIETQPVMQYNADRPGRRSRLLVGPGVGKLPRCWENKRQTANFLFDNTVLHNPVVLLLVVPLIFIFCRDHGTSARPARVARARVRMVSGNRGASMWFRFIVQNGASIAMAAAMLGLSMAFSWSQSLPILPRLEPPLPPGHRPMIELVCLVGLLVPILCLLRVFSIRLVPGVGIKSTLWIIFLLGYPLVVALYYKSLSEEVLLAKYARRKQADAFAALICIVCGWTTALLSLPSQQRHLIACLVLVAHIPEGKIASTLISEEACHFEVVKSVAAFQAGYVLGSSLRVWIENLLAASTPETRDKAAAVSAGLRCSITNALVVDPVTAADGQIYDREGISRWLECHDTSPNTGATLPSKHLVSLPAVRETVAQMIEAGAVPVDDACEWLLQAGVRAARHQASRAEAKRLLRRAIEAGSVDAGYHYALLLISDAAAAGLPEAAAVQRRLHARSPLLYAVGGLDDEDQTTASVERLTVRLRPTKVSIGTDTTTTTAHAPHAAPMAPAAVAAAAATRWQQSQQHDSADDGTMGRWAATARLKSARHGAVCALLDGSLYVAGGLSPSEVAMRSVESLDLTGSWEQQQPAGAGAGGGGGGGDGGRGDSSVPQWRPIAPMASARDGGVCAVLQGRLYVGGGCNKAGTYQSTCEYFDPLTQSWSSAPPMRTPRFGAASAVVDGCWIVAGGQDGRCRSSALQSVERFDPVTGTWSELADLQVARTGAAGAVLDGRMYVVGGADCDMRHSSVECLDAAGGGGTWRLVSAMSTARFGCAAAVVDSKLLVVGGSDSSHMSVSTIECFDPATQAWRSVHPPMDVARARLTLVAVGAQDFFPA